MSATTVLMGSGPAAAADSQGHEFVELEISNTTGENIDIAARTSKDGSRGMTASEERNGIPAFPASTFESANGTSRNFAVDLVGDDDWAPYLGVFYKYDNFFSIQAASKSGTDKSQVSLTHKGEDRGRELPPLAIGESNTEAFSFSLEEQPNPSSGFDRKYRVVITKSATYKGDQFPSMEVQKLTGSSVARPVYKVTIPEVKRKFESLPADLKVSPYVIHGRGISPDSSQEIGKVLPVANPVVDRAEKTITYPKANFFFEYPEGYFPQYYLTVSDDAGGQQTQEISRAPGPPADLKQSAVTSISAAPATGDPVPANGVAQEGLKLKLVADGETVSPDHRADLNELYDYLYFRDANGELITGMYEGPSSGGYSAVSEAKGAYVNSLGGMQQASTESNRAYLSTTQRTAPTFRAELNVSGKRQSPETRVERADASDTVQGTASQGISLTQGIADTAVGAYHHHNGEKPEAALLTKYQTTAALSSLPLRQPYGGEFVSQNGWRIAHLSHSTRLDETPDVQTQLVNGKGTYVEVPRLRT
ncbi:hypothetical protein ACFV6B_39490 [Streptomyces microflavus]|uniref:hypothetical protein n=1 Tax=Streptomyces microflavus TaxID=1919 RepID=UPI00365093A3